MSIQTVDRTYVEDVEDEVRSLVAAAKDKRSRRFGKRIIDTIVSLWAANIHLQAQYRQVKAENASLHHLLNAILARDGVLRFTREELDAVSWDSRVVALLVKGSPDLVIQRSDKGLLFSKAPRWFAEAAEGRPVPELNMGTPRLTPVIDVTNLYGEHDA